MSNQTIHAAPGDVITIVVDSVGGQPEQFILPYVMNTLPSQVAGQRVAGAHLRLPYGTEAKTVLAYADTAAANGQTLIFSLSTGNPGNCWLPGGYTTGGGAIYASAWATLFQAGLDRHPAIKAYLYSFGPWDEFNRDYTGADGNAYFNAYLEGWLALCRSTSKPVACQPATMSNYYRYWLLNSYQLLANSYVKMDCVQAEHLYGKQALNNDSEDLGMLALIHGYINGFGQGVPVALEPKALPSGIGADDTEVVGILKACTTFYDVQAEWLPLLGLANAS